MTTYHGKNTWMCGDCWSVQRDYWDGSSGSIQCLVGFDTAIAFGKCAGHHERVRGKEREVKNELRRIKTLS
jgi:hypothetical protein